MVAKELGWRLTAKVPGWSSWLCRYRQLDLDPLWELWGKRRVDLDRSGSSGSGAPEARCRDRSLEAEARS